MPTTTVPKTSIFETDNTDPKLVEELIAEGVKVMAANGDIDWHELPDHLRPHTVGGSSPIGYSRSWAIVRRAWLEMFDVGAIAVLPVDADPVKQQLKQANVVQRMRNEQELSWGEIAIRLGVPESKVRKAYRNGETKKDLGLRIGKGGRWAFDDPVLYLDNRKVEGAQIPVDFKGHPTPEMLLNFRSDVTEEKLTATERGNRTKAVKKVVLLRAHAADKAATKAERETFLAKAAELMAKYNLTEDHIRRAA